MKYPNRRKMTLSEIREESTAYAVSHDDSIGIMGLVDVENMGWCRDGVTRWYHFHDADGRPAVYYKH